jgi:hypothetical protein
MEQLMQFKFASHVLLVVVVSVAYLAISTVISYRRLQHIPGPRIAAFSQLWLARATAKGSLYKTLGRVLDEYGESRCQYVVSPELTAVIKDHPRGSHRTWSCSTILRSTGQQWLLDLPIDGVHGIRECSLIHESTIYSPNEMRDDMLIYGAKCFTPTLAKKSPPWKL